MHFDDLEDGDIITLSLKGQFKVSKKFIGEHSSYINLENLAGYDDWSFDVQEGYGWEAIVVGHDHTEVTDEH